jgi:tetratricopeptide (TPR) repeat protein
LQASYFAELNKPEEATKVWRKILELDPSNTDAKIAVAAGMKIAGDDLGFLHSLKPLFVNKNVAYDKKMKEIIPYIQKLAVTHDQKLGSALTEALQMLNETNPGNAKTYAAMADVAQNTGQIKDAVQYYKKSLSLDKSIFSVWEQLMYLLDQIRDYPSLLSTSNDLLDLYPALAVANYWNAYSFVKNDKPDEALESANIGISAAKNNQAIQYKLHIVNGMAYSLKKDTNKSKESFKLAQELNPKIDWAYLAEARELAKTPGNLQQALSLVEQALKLNPESFEAWATKAFILSQNNDFEKAKDLYAQSISKGGSDYAQILEEYGDVLFKLNDKESALKYWKSAVDKGIELPQLRKKIEDVKP